MGIELINKKSNINLSTKQIDVLVNGKEEQEKNIDITANGSYIVEPDNKAVLSKVNINVDTPEPKEEQEKNISITVNGSYEVLPEEEKVLNRVVINVDTPEPKEEQEKEIVISENGDYEVFPDDKKVLKRVSVKADVVDNAINELEELIDNSGVIDTEGTVTEKVEQLIDLAAIRGLVNECLTAHASDLKYFFSKTSIADLGVFDFSTTTNFRELFQQCNSLKVAELDTSSGGNFSRVFVNCTNLETVILTSTSRGRDFDTAFGYCTKLKKISTLDLSSATILMYIFYNCFALEEISFVAETIKQSISFVHSPKLTPESIQSIIDGLATVSTAQTLTLHKDITLTDEQKATIYNKGWTLAQ